MSGRKTFELAGVTFLSLLSGVSKTLKQLVDNKNKMKAITDLVQHIGEDDETRVEQVEYQPNLHWLDGGSRRQASVYIKIYRGQHHHTGSTTNKMSERERKTSCSIHVDGID